MPARDIIQKMRPEVLWSDVELHDLLPANADYVVNKGSLYAVQYNYNATTKWHDFIVLRYDKDLCSTIVDDIEERKKILENVDFPSPFLPTNAIRSFLITEKLRSLSTLF